MTPTARAVVWMVGAILSFSLMAVAGREAASDLDTFEVMLYRSLLGMVLVVGFGALTGRLGNIPTRRPGLHVIRNIGHFTGQNLWFYAVTLIPLAQLFSFEFTTPIWVALLAPLMLGETMTKTRIIAALIGFAGILVIARPGIVTIEIGHAIALLCSIFFAASVLTTKQLSRTDTVWTILFWMTVMQAVMGLAMAGYDGDIALPFGINIGWTVLIGICGLTAHLSLTMALSLAPASVIAPVDFLRLPLIAVIGMLVYGEPLEIAVFAGAGLILAGNLYNIRAEARR